MSTSRDEESLFAAALDITDPQARAEYLERACANSPKLRERVAQLLSAFDAGDFLEANPAEVLDTAAFGEVTERAGSSIGPYKLLEQIGEGGMGLVFMAEQTQPIRRRVALKIIKPGLDTQSVVARFEAERQALALMDHPNIARVFDAGATATGRPYFVMELVRGVPITDYCRDRGLELRERLELFINVCQAVQHAHQKGIIHRDLKPSNILVAHDDTRPVPKVIDFGVAKATTQQLTERTLFTHFAQLIGTPLYMSPEQAEFNYQDVDTRSDVYSLGVVLYELLTGTTPFESDRLRSVGPDEMRWIICEEDPPKPSTRATTMAAAASTQTTEAAAKSPGQGKVQGRALKGDLDWIVMKCLDKDRRRRYESASALAADLQRHLDGEPITARPVTVASRLVKWSRRHVAAIWATTITLLSITITLVACIGWLLHRIAEIEGATSNSVRASTLAMQGKFAEAASEFETSFRKNPNDHRDGMWAGCCYLSAGDVESYRKVSAKMIDRFEGTADALAARRLGWTILLGSTLERDLPRMRKTAKRLLDPFGPVQYDACLASELHGILAYRSGDYEKAIEWADRSISLTGGRSIKAQNLCVQAMSLHKLGRRDESLAGFAEAVALIDDEFPDGARKLPPGNAWELWVHCDILLREAAGVLGVSYPSAPEMAFDESALIDLSR